VVRVDEKCELLKEEKQKIARQFNFSETVFLYHNRSTELPRAEIYTPVNEMDFAGHPVIGTGHILFRQMLQGLPLCSEDSSNQKNATLLTKAGPVGIWYDSGKQTVSAEIPHNVHTHSRPLLAKALSQSQPALRESLTSSQMLQGFPVVSIVKGVTYALADFTDSSDLFAKVSAGSSPLVELDDGWSPSFAGTMYYRRLSFEIQDDNSVVQDLRVRMIAIDLEDPACGSGSATLAAYLALQDGRMNGRYIFNLDQGSEIHRQSHITVDLMLDESGTSVSKILLVGQATLSMSGTLYLPEI